MANAAMAAGTYLIAQTNLEAPFLRRRSNAKQSLFALESSSRAHRQTICSWHLAMGHTLRRSLLGGTAVCRAIQAILAWPQSLRGRAVPAVLSRAAKGKLTTCTGTRTQWKVGFALFPSQSVITHGHTVVRLHEHAPPPSITPATSHVAECVCLSRRCRSREKHVNIGGSRTSAFFVCQRQRPSRGGAEASAPGSSRHKGGSEL